MISFFGDLKRHLYRDHPRWIILIIDMFIVFVSYVLSIYVLYDLKGFADVSMMLKKLIIILFVYFTFFVSNSTFKGIVRQTGIQDAIKIFKTTATAYIVLMLFMIIVRSVVERGSTVSDYLRLPYGLLTMQFCMLLVFMIGSRVVYRTVFEYLSLSARKLENVLIFGASRPGLSTYSLLKEDPQVKYHVIAFVEDQLNRVGKRLAGLKILDITEITSDFIKRNRITDVIIAVENNDPERLQYVSDWFHQLGLELKIMSPARILPNSRVNREIRPLEIDDLLGRKPIKLDHHEIEAEMEGKVILVTGAAGSIGSELARQIARRSYKKLILLDQAESPLYDIQQSIKCSYP